ncbi:MAG: succinate dehydrogenase, hydrophobic membrane anchor protein [Candidatus Aminicenantes bacterium]|nr:succinate dehydrogenase, hydrophobic membrane anchor protein [Candidatus Aminicenantes bacterium]MDH5714298.1 succinate dehydrogenase, hydrophobic membrane anchor protein [Candidatus Aminicenantes bacterium]
MGNKKLYVAGGGWSWLFQRLSGVYLLLIILLHFWFIHYTGTGEITYQQVATRLATPFWKTLDVSFLLLALYHGLNGVWAVAQDWVKRDWLRMLIYGVIVVVAFIFGVLGMITVIGFKPQVL